MEDKVFSFKSLRVFLLLSLLLFAVPFLTSQTYILSILIRVYIFSVFAMSYDLLMGFTGIVSFGHALFFGSGAYALGLLLKNTSLPFVVILVLVVLIAAFIAIIKGFFSLRVRGIYFAMVTLAFAQFFWILAQKLTHITGGDDGIPGILGPSFLLERVNFYYLALVFLLGAYILLWLFVHSPTGRILIGIRENEQRMQMLGIPVFFYKLCALTLSGILAALAGAMYALFINFAFPSLLHLNTTIDVLMMTIVGGVGTLHGPVLGAFVVQILAHFLSSAIRQWILIFGVLYILIVAFLPLGILGGVKHLRGLIEKQQRKMRSLGKKLEP